MYTSLARKYRPQKFEDIVGQEVSVRIIKNSIESEKISHGYIFAGMRGTGKTTLARIFAKSLNCIKGPTVNICNECESCKLITKSLHPDVIEMDAGSQTSVDDIRSLKEMAMYPPMIGKYKVFIIDEAHMLSNSAFNALLKVLEEPPEFIVFILATTEVWKIPETVISRLIKIDFRKIPEKTIKERLIEICKRENIDFDDEGLEIISKEGDGSLRDAISIMESVWLSEGNAKIKSVEKVLGIPPKNGIILLAKSILEGEKDKAIFTLREFIERGYDPRRIFSELIDKLKDALLQQNELQKFGTKKILMTIKACLNSIPEFEYSFSKECALEIIVIKLSLLQSIKFLSEFLEDRKIKNKKIEEIKEIRKEEKEKITVEDIYQKLKDFGKKILAENVRNILVDVVNEREDEIVILVKNGADDKVRKEIEKVLEKNIIFIEEKEEKEEKLEDFEEVIF